MTWGAGFGEQTATVKRGALGSFTTVGTVSIHLQELPSKAKVDFGGIYPMDAKVGMIHGTCAIEIRQDDILEVGSWTFTVLDVKEWTTAHINFVKLILSGMDVEI